MSENIHIGTSGWHYDHWKETFYPGEISSKEMLGFYAGHFRAVEVNNSFYQLPETETLETWRNAVPAEFVFTVKASRYITHMKKLKDPAEPVRQFFGRIRTLGKQLGPILFQLPPNWNCNADRLKDFIATLPKNSRYAFEFRDPSWFNDDVYRILAEAGCAFCIYDLAGRQSPKTVTTDFIYVRLHGPAKAYQGNYSSQTLAGWAGAFSSWASQGKEIFCFFDNDQKGYAPANAMSLNNMLNRKEKS